RRDGDPCPEPTPSASMHPPRAWRSRGQLVEPAADQVRTNRSSDALGTPGGDSCRPLRDSDPMTPPARRQRPDTARCVEEVGPLELRLVHTFDTLPAWERASSTN